MNRIESETKLELSEADFRKLLERGAVHKCTDQLNIYYDSEAKLSGHRITFRIRLAHGSAPLMTLKIPQAYVGGRRDAVEIEQQLDRGAGKLLGHPVPLRVIAADRDLPDEFSRALSILGVCNLERVGWMRNRRWLLMVGQISLELDMARMPDGTTLFEVEIEDPEPERQRLAVEYVRAIAASARPSLSSKYERFSAAVSSNRANGVATSASDGFGGNGTTAMAPGSKSTSPDRGVNCA